MANLTGDETPRFSQKGKPEGNWRGFVRFYFCWFCLLFYWVVCVCSPEAYWTAVLSTVWAAVQAGGGGAGRFRFWALTPAVEPEPCSCSLLSSGSAGIALWALGKSGGIVCPLQAKQSSYINGEPGDTRLAQTNPNIQFKTLRNDNQMSKAYVSASKSSGLCSGGGYGGRQARKQSFRVGSDSVNLRGIGVVFCSEAAIPAMIFHYTIIHTGVVI